MSHPRPGPRPWVLLCALLALHLAPFSLGRLGLFATCSELLGPLQGAGVLRAFLRGVLFDLSIVLMLLAPVLIGLALPFRWAARQRWRRTMGWLAFLPLPLFSVLIAADGLYFARAGRHVGDELVALDTEGGFLLGMAFGEYPLAMLLFILGSVAAALAWRRWVVASLLPMPAPHWALCLLLIPAFALGIRGKLTGKSLNIVHAFERGSLGEGYLVLNGPFSMYHSSLRSTRLDTDYMPWSEALATVRAQWRDGREVQAQPENFPLERSFTAQRSEPLNLVILLLESWDGRFVDALRVRRGEDALGATPFFDELAQEGVLYTELFAVGQNSMNAFGAILAGMPSLPGVPYLGRGMESSRLTYLPRLAAAAGSRTFFVQGAKRSSFRRDAVAMLAGFDDYFGMRDVCKFTKTEPMAKWGAWDGATLQMALSLCEQSTEPFMGLVFTVTTHEPFAVPSAADEIFGTDTEFDRYLNTVAYSDRCLRAFFHAARKMAWYERTVFLLVGDHGLRRVLKPEDPLQRHRIPALLLAPGLEAQVDSRIASQTDLLPTLIDFCGWTGPHASFGRSLLAPPQALDADVGRGALCRYGNLMLRVEEGGWILHDLERRLGASPGSSPELLSAIEKRMQAELQVGCELLRRNRLLSSPER